MVIRWWSKSRLTSYTPDVTLACEQGRLCMLKTLIKDVQEMHWAPRLILAVVVLKTLAIMYREAAIFG